jgi:hypothetical protein
MYSVKLFRTDSMVPSLETHRDIITMHIAILIRLLISGFLVFRLRARTTAIISSAITEAMFMPHLHY